MKFGILRQSLPLYLNLSQLKILSFKEKDEWELTPKYNIGNKRETDADNE